MIPTRQILERLDFTFEDSDGKTVHVQGYEPHELEFLDRLRRISDAIKDPLTRIVSGRRLIREFWPDELERFQKTSLILNKRGRPQLLWLNDAQKRFWDEVIIASRNERRPCRCIVLKARQLGFSTLMQNLHFFWSNENPYRNSLTVSYDEDSTVFLFGKAKFNHDWQFFPLQTASNSQTHMSFSDPGGVDESHCGFGSMFKTITANNMKAARSYTFQHVHLSEVAFWANPDIVYNGIDQTVMMIPGTTIVTESTAKGAEGFFYDLWNAAEAGRGIQGFFAPWFWDPEYHLPFASGDHRRRFMRSMHPEDREYMTKHRLKPEQMLWRQEKIRKGFNGNRLEFRQEYPATAQEAFLSSGRPAFDPDAIERLMQASKEPRYRAEIMLTE